MKLEIYALRNGKRIDLVGYGYTDLHCNIILALPQELRQKIKSISPDKFNNEDRLIVGFVEDTFVNSSSCSVAIVPYTIPSAGSTRFLFWQVKAYATSGLWIEPMFGVIKDLVNLGQPHPVTTRAYLFFMAALAPIILPFIIVIVSVYQKIKELARRAFAYAKEWIAARAPRRAPARGAPGRRAPHRRPPRPRRAWKDIKNI